MASEQFDYDAKTEVDILSVADAIRSSHRLAPLTDEARELRRLEYESYRWECRQRGEQRAFEYRERQAEAEAIARAEHAADNSGS